MKDRRKRVLSALLVAVAFSLATLPTLAQELVIHEFSGTITYVSGNPLGLGLTNGDAVEGRITYDKSLPPDSNTGTVAGYIQPLPSGMSIVTGSSTVQSAGDASLQMQNNSFGSDGINGYFVPVTVNGGVQSGAISFNFSDATATVFASTVPLPESLDVARFTLLTGAIFDGSATAFFSVETLTLEKQEIESDDSDGWWRRQKRRRIAP